MSYLPEKTIKYKTYIKTALVESLKPVFNNHLDKNLQPTKVSIDLPKERQSFPSLVVRFYEKEIKNGGVGHIEHFVDKNDKAWKFKHYFYTGDVEFAIYSLSSLDRDLVSDTLVQTISMGDLAEYTNQFFSRIYPENLDAVPDSIGHYININSDQIQGFGETQTATPWNAEDDFVYTISYRVNVFGEFYSLPQDAPYEFVKDVFTYPYIEGVESPAPQFEIPQ